MRVAQFGSRLVMMVVFGLLLAGLPLAAQDAQDSAARDPLALANRLLGYDPSAPALPPPPVSYGLGDTLDFWVTKDGAQTPTRIPFELAAGTPEIYLWVEQGLSYPGEAMQQTAVALTVIFRAMRVRDNYGQMQVQPDPNAPFVLFDQLALPDVDSDPHLYILFASGLAETQNSLYNPNHSLMVEAAPGGYSNQHEMLIVSVSPDVPLGSQQYLTLLVRQFYQMLSYYNYPGQAVWLRDALSWYTLLQIFEAGVSAADIAPYYADPNLPLFARSGGAEFGAQQLFLNYVRQRLGLGVFRQLFTQPGQGLVPLDAVLARSDIVDLVTSEPLSARDLFADFVMANILNNFVGDGRYLHLRVQLDDNQIPQFVPIQDQFDGDLGDVLVNQFGTRYLVFSSSQPVAFSLFFSGQPNTLRLPMPPDENNQFYWSGDGLNQAASLTRPVDLTGVRSATLTFNAWYALAEGWNYTYVQVSADGGATWAVLPASASRSHNPYGVAYGPGFTGLSTSEQPRPIPYLGIILEGDGLTINTILPDSPLAGTNVREGDIIVGFDGQRWAENTTIPAWIAGYRPGQSVTLLVERAGETFDVPVTIAAHPTRVIEPQPLWLPQTVDLSAYAGQSILLRFEYISLPDQPNDGFAIDDIAIAEIGFRDDAESGVPGWTLNGWRQMTNSVPQRFLVQTATLGPDDGSSRTQQLIGPNSAETGGLWNLTLLPDQVLILAISGLNDDTSQPGVFNLSLRSASN